MKRIVICVAFVLTVYSQLFCQKDLPVFSQYGEHFINAGISYKVVVEDNIAYVTSLAGLLIMDISNPESPELLRCYYTDDQFWSDEIFVSNKIAFIVTHKYYPKVHFLNITDPYNPELLYAFELTGSLGVESICVFNDCLFIGTGDDLYIYDITDLLNPQLIAEYPDIEVIDMQVIDNYIYMVEDDRNFGVMDISDITKPEMVFITGNYFTYMHSIDVVENQAYVTGNALYIFDISEPENPEQLSAFEIQYLRDIEVIDSVAYAISQDSVFTINIAEPSSPVIIDTYSYHGTTLDLDVDNDIIVVTRDYQVNQPWGIGFFDFDNNQHIRFITDYYTDEANQLDVEGNYAYIANGYAGLCIMDITDASNPMKCSELLKGTYVYEVIAENEFAYVRAPEEGLKIVLVSDPYNPQVVSTYDIPHYVTIHSEYSIAKYNDYLYLGGDGFTELYVIEVSDPYNPELVGFINVNDWSPGLDVYENHLYVAGYWGGLEIFDLKNPVDPQKIGYHPMGLAFKVCGGKDFACVIGTVEEYGGIEIFDLTDLTNPIHIDTYDQPCRDMYYSAPYVFASVRDYHDVNSAIHILDMSHINSPALVQEVQNVKSNAICYENGKIYAVEDYRFKIFADSTIVSAHNAIEFHESSNLKVFPNPSLSSFTIEFSLQSNSDVNINIYNTSGILVSELINKSLNSGNYRIEWDCKDKSVNELPAGVYIVSLKTDSIHESEKIIITSN